MADSGPSPQALDHPPVTKNIAHQADAAVSVKLRFVMGDDTGRFLASVLQRVQTERGQGRRLVMAENAEDGTFFA